MLGRKNCEKQFSFFLIERDDYDWTSLLTFENIL